MKSIQLLIPMAGIGSRFKNAGYSVLKPFLPVGKKSMIETVIDNLNSDFIIKIILVVRLDKGDEVSLFQNLIQLDKLELVIIDLNTDGPASTCYLAKDHLDLEAPLIIANSDQYLAVNMGLEYESWSDSDDGFIWCMNDTDPKWSYALTDKLEFVLEIQEKKVISELATCGIYGFKKAKYFFDAFAEMYHENNRTNGEFYVAPLYNYLIKRNLKIKSKNLGPTNKIMFGLGTPEDYEYFITTSNLDTLGLNR